jgi:hypothetical protein
VLCSVSNAYGTGSSRERRHARNDAHASKVEKFFVLLFQSPLLFTILSFKNKKEKKTIPQNYPLGDFLTQSLARCYHSTNQTSSCT